MKGNEREEALGVLTGELKRMVEDADGRLREEEGRRLEAEGRIREGEERRMRAVEEVTGVGREEVDKVKRERDRLRDDLERVMGRLEQSEEGRAKAESEVLRRVAEVKAKAVREVEDAREVIRGEVKAEFRGRVEGTEGERDGAEREAGVERARRKKAEAERDDARGRLAEKDEVRRGERPGRNKRSEATAVLADIRRTFLTS